jgi:hypothetical protein
MQEMGDLMIVSLLTVMPVVQAAKARSGTKRTAPVRAALIASADAPINSDLR